MITHELQASKEREKSIKMPTEKALGRTFAIICFAIAAYKFWAHQTGLGWAIVGSAILGIALLKPQLLKPLNIIWFRLGLFLHSIMTPLILGIIFFCAVTTTALLMRLCGKRPLQLKFDKISQSYWIPHPSNTLPPESFRNQF